jgi:dihydroorotate dehydrogenase
VADLCTKIAGIALGHPILLASGPLSWNADAILRATRAGAGAAVTKTIRRRATVNPIPHIAAAGDGLLNAEGWSDLDAEDWIERGERPSLRASV